MCCGPRPTCIGSFVDEPCPHNAGLGWTAASESRKWLVAAVWTSIVHVLSALQKTLSLGFACLIKLSTTTKQPKNVVTQDVLKLGCIVQFTAPCMLCDELFRGAKLGGKKTGTLSVNNV